MRSNSAVDDVGVGDLVGLRLDAPPGVLSSLTYLNPCKYLWHPDKHLTKTLVHQIENHPQPASSSFPFSCVYKVRESPIPVSPLSFQ